MLEANGFSPDSGPRAITPELWATLAAQLEPIVTPGFVCRFIGGDNNDLVGEFPGTDGLARAWADWLETFDHLELDVGESLDGERCLVTVGRQRGTSAMAGIEVDSDALSVWHFDGDRLASAEFYLERDAALRAAGLL